MTDRPANQIADRDGARRDVWLSAHLFIAAHSVGGEAADRVILHCVEPFVRRCQRADLIDRHFFVRYPVGGSHIRLRLRGASDRIEPHLRPALLEWIEQSRAADVPIARCEWVAYEPEVQRYGGPRAIELAERIFQDSSETAFALLAGVAGTRSSRLGKGLLAMLALMHAFFDNAAAVAAFAGRYAEGYLHARRDPDERVDRLAEFDRAFDRQAERLMGAVDDAFERLVEHAPVSPAIDAYHAAMVERREALRECFHRGVVEVQGRACASWGLCVEALVPSFVHMTSNRLGLSVPEETYVAHLIRRALAATHAPAVECR
ncbi:MAG TPA: thiopeptide-type bacteriocin biosynthesis protein [Gemmatimonadaceae bacterium]|nr:thiopeptide-type bacteriocin biosynthesis protein [Gemmatimonadaceae bacterium]